MSKESDLSRDEPIFQLRSHVVAGLALAVFLFAGCGGWATYARLNGAVIAQGTVTVDQNLKEVQHRDGGIVAEIAVKQGDPVQAGQVLLRLDDTASRAELSIVRVQLIELLARRARLLAERDGLERIEFPREIHTLAPDVAMVTRDEARLFDGNRFTRRSQSEQLELAIIQTGEEIRGLNARRSAKIEETELLGLEREKVVYLFNKGLTDGSRVHALNREWARINGEKGEIEASMARANVRITDARLQIIALDQNARTEAQRELRTLESRISELNDRRVVIEDRLSRTELRAPLTGRVNELSVYTIGGVITPAAKVVTLVPADARLRVEAKVAPTDIDQVERGQPARLRFSAFNQNTTPELRGRVVQVSPATIRDPVGGTVSYIVEIAIDDDLTKLGDRELVPGMPVEVFISGVERTALAYLAKPLMDHFNRAFREQ
ncbi:HlyD family type I secretion periplasmic adaptor subunit [Xanthobacter autotrophicus]|uniref:HlyD family type I secretion periplasmic adaptor subunit n=1 Tax=Xanthobacter autotrophicus TaxID=280 RepID=UPI00372A83FD